MHAESSDKSEHQDSQQGLFFEVSVGASVDNLKCAIVFGVFAWAMCCHDF